ncbi:putative integral membrane protein (TIGR02206 family) [Peptoniphilus olsenii]|uniref:Integral membrane protein (TIGR02206 family) n=1 Tax=Peptoniphilus olsenii TaxID=411570 RepID=A0ABV2J833_9FIRM
MNYFFRYIGDNQTNLNINLIRVLVLFSVFFATRWKNSKVLLKISLLGLILLQLILFCWYAGNDKLFLIEGLPFYHCRIAAISMAIFYFKNKNELAKYFAWLGIIGSIIAVSFPDPSRFLWPHVTNITYIDTHLLLVIAGIIIINFDTKLKLNNIIKITLTMNIIILFVNAMTGGNYGYLSHLPDNLDIEINIWQLFLIMSFLLIVVINILEKSQNKYNIKYKNNNAPIVY